MSINPRERELAQQLGQELNTSRWRCAVAESCTGGLISAALTDIAGSSQWFDRGFVTYTDQSKMDMLGVESKVLLTHGAVSEPIVRAMAEGALSFSQADLSVAVSGIAGPGGGSYEKPIGMVWIAWSGKTITTHSQLFYFKGDRQAIRSQSVIAALEGLITRCTSFREI